MSPPDNFEFCGEKFKLIIIIQWFQDISKLNLPQAFVEYRVRLYSKIKKKNKANWKEIKKQLIMYVM